MILATLLPFALGLVLAALVFSLGTILGVSGLVAMSVYYAVIVAITIILGLIPEKRRNWQGGLEK